MFSAWRGRSRPLRGAGRPGRRGTPLPGNVRLPGEALKPLDAALPCGDLLPWLILPAPALAEEGERFGSAQPPMVAGSSSSGGRHPGGHVRQVVVREVVVRQVVAGGCGNGRRRLGA